MEIWAIIFDMIPDKLIGRAWPDYCTEHTRNTEQLEPIPRTCRYWRAIALGTPSLWSTAMTPSVPAGPKLLARYVRYYRPDWPLYVHLSPREPTRLEFAFLREHGERVHELSCWPIPCESADYLDAFLSIPLPNLRHCSIGLGLCATVHPIKPLFGGSKNLRSLAFVGLTFIPQGPFPALTTLYIAADWRCRGAPIVAEDFLKLLMEMPQLRVLETRNMARCMYLLVMHVSQRIRLARLETLKLVDKININPLRMEGDVRFINHYRALLLGFLLLPKTCRIVVEPTDIVLH